MNEKCYVLTPFCRKKGGEICLATQTLGDLFEKPEEYPDFDNDFEGRCYEETRPPEPENSKKMI